MKSPYSKKGYAITFTLLLLLTPLVAAGKAEQKQGVNLSDTECIAPANPGGGWDFTCRQVAKILYDLKLVNTPMKVTNLSGGGGAVAYSHVVTKRADDPNLIVAASTSTTTRLAQNAFTGFDKDQVRWLSAIGADYGAIAVAADSPYQDLVSLLDAMDSRPENFNIAGGGAAGGWDHLKVLLLAKKHGNTRYSSYKYLSFNSGGQAIVQMLGGHAQLFSGDLSEAKGFALSGDIRILAILADERVAGELASVPTAKEQGVDVVAVNWRGFYVPKKISEEAFNYWNEAMAKVYHSAEWRKSMEQGALADFYRDGSQISEFVTQQIKDIADLSREIGLL